jgi:hypothetical protein
MFELKKIDRGTRLDFTQTDIPEALYEERLLRGGRNGTGRSFGVFLRKNKFLKEY